MAQGAVKEWLSSLGLGQYAEAFIDNGYDDMVMCHSLNDEDIDAIGVESAEDRQLILQESKKLQEKPKGTAGPIYYEFEAEQTVKIPRMKLKIMILEEMKRDQVNLDEEPYSNPDGTPGESLDDLIEVYALQFNTVEEDVRSCVEALRESVVSSRSSVSSENRRPISPVQKEQPKRPVPSKKPSDYKSTTESKKPPPKPAAPPVVGSRPTMTEKPKQPPTKPQRTKPSENIGQYINFDEASSMLSPSSEQEKPPTVEDKQPKPAPRKPSFEDGIARIPPQKPKARPVISKPSQKLEDTGKKENNEDKTEAVTGQSGISDGEVSSVASREGTPGTAQTESKLSTVRLSVSKSFQGLRAKLKKKKTSTSSTSLSVSATPSPAASPPPARANLGSDVGGLAAKDITMSDEDRMKLMIMVKEGKCTVDEAWSQIQSYEEEKKAKAVEGEEVIIRKAETGEEMNHEEQPVEIKEAKREPPPKPTRLQPQPSAAPPAPSVEEEKSEVSKDEKEETVAQPVQPVAPPRRNRSAKTSQTEINQDRRQSWSDATKDKPLNGEAEERTGQEAEKAVEDVPAKKTLLSGVVFGIQQPQAAAPMEKEVGETGGEQETIQSEQGGKGDEAVGKPGKRGFLKNILGIGKKDKSKKEQKAETPSGHMITAAATDKEAVNEPSGQTTMEEVETEAAGEDRSRQKRSGTFLDSLGKLKGKFKKKRIKSEESELTDRRSKGSDRTENLLNPALSRESISSGASGGSYESSNAIGYTGPTVGRARVIQDFVPSAYDMESLPLKVGDMINVIDNPENGSWTGELNGRIGLFKFIYVEMLEEESDVFSDIACSSPVTRRKAIEQLPSTVEEFLVRVNLQNRQQLFALNGYDSLDVIKKIDRQALDELGINDTNQRQTILTLVMQLNYAAAISAVSLHAPVPPSKGRSPAPSSPQSKRPSPLSRNILSETQVLSPSEKPRKPLFLLESKPVAQSNTEGKAAPTGQRKPTPHPAPLLLKSATISGDVRLSPKPKRPAPLAPVRGGSVSEDRKPTSPSSPKSSSLTEFPGHEEGKRPQARKRLGTTVEHPVTMSTSEQPKPQPRPRSATVATKPMFARQLPSPKDKTQLESAETAKPTPQKPIKPTPYSQAADKLHVTEHKPIPVPAAKPTPIPPAKAALTSQVKSPVTTSAPLPQHRESVSANDPTAPVAPVRRKRTSKDFSANLNIVKKLKADLIDLTEAPYSTEDGSCGIPIGLIHRYAEELRLSPKEVLNSLEKVRSDELNAAGRQVVPMDESLAEKDWTDSVDTSSVHGFLLCLGLPMYIDSFSTNFSGIEEMRNLMVEQIRELGVKDPRHVKRIQMAIGKVKERT